MNDELIQHECLQSPQRFMCSIHDSHARLILHGRTIGCQLLEGHADDEIILTPTLSSHERESPRTVENPRSAHLPKE